MSEIEIYRALKSSKDSVIDWEKMQSVEALIRPTTSDDDPALILLRAQLAALDKQPPAEGQIPGMQMTWAEAREDLRLQIEEEIARYRALKAGRLL